MFRGEGCASKGAAKDDVSDGEAYGHVSHIICNYLNITSNGHIVFNAARPFQRKKTKKKDGSKNRSNRTLSKSKWARRPDHRVTPPPTTVWAKRAGIVLTSNFSVGDGIVSEAHTGVLYLRKMIHSMCVGTHVAQ